MEKIFDEIDEMIIKMLISNKITDLRIAEIGLCEYSSVMAEQEKCVDDIYNLLLEKFWLAHEFINARAGDLKEQQNER
jgi:hypothetical protein